MQTERIWKLIVLENKQTVLNKSSQIFIVTKLYLVEIIRVIFERITYNL